MDGVKLPGQQSILGSVAMEQFGVSIEVTKYLLALMIHGMLCMLCILLLLLLLFNNNSHLFKRIKVDGALIQISGIYNPFFKIFLSLKNIYLFIFAVGDKNHVWGVNRAGAIYYRTNGDVSGKWVQG